MNLPDGEAVNYSAKGLDGQEMRLKKGSGEKLYEIEHRDTGGNAASLRLTRLGLRQLRWMIAGALDEGGEK